MKSTKRPTLPRGLRWDPRSPNIFFSWRDGRGRLHQKSTNSADPAEALAFKQRFQQEEHDAIEERRSRAADQSRLSLSTAAQMYFDWKAATNAVGTISREKRIFRQVVNFMGANIQLRRIDLELLREYQQERRKQISPTMRKAVTPRSVNYELQLIAWRHATRKLLERRSGGALQAIEGIEEPRIRPVVVEEGAIVANRLSRNSRLAEIALDRCARWRNRYDSLRFCLLGLLLSRSGCLRRLRPQVFQRPASIRLLSRNCRVRVGRFVGNARAISSRLAPPAWDSTAARKVQTHETIQALRDASCADRRTCVDQRLSRRT